MRLPVEFGFFQCRELFGFVGFEKVSEAAFLDRGFCRFGKGLWGDFMGGCGIRGRKRSIGSSIRSGIDSGWLSGCIGWRIDRVLWFVGCCSLLSKPLPRLLGILWNLDLLAGGSSMASSIEEWAMHLRDFFSGKAVLFLDSDHLLDRRRWWCR